MDITSYPQLDKPTIKELLEKTDIWDLDKILFFSLGRHYDASLFNPESNDAPVRQYKWALKAAAKHRFKLEDKDIEALRCIKYIETPEKIICTVDKTDFIPWASRQWPKDTRIVYDLWFARRAAQGKNIEGKTQKEIMSLKAREVYLAALEEYLVTNKNPLKFETSKPEIRKKVLNVLGLPSNKAGSCDRAFTIKELKELRKAYIKK